MKYNRRNFFITLWSLIIGCNLTEWKNTLVPPQKEYYKHLADLLHTTMPNLMAYDVCGVQPMKSPVGLVFSMKTRHILKNKNCEKFDNLL